jgi:hypothetical protein
MIHDDKSNESLSCQEQRRECDTQQSSDTSNGKSRRVAAATTSSLGRRRSRGSGLGSGGSGLGCTASCSGSTRAGGTDGSKGRVEDGACISGAVRTCGNAGGIGHGGDGTERLGWLGVGDDGTVGSVYAREVLVLAFAGLKGTILSVVGCVVAAADAVVDVLAVVGGVGASGITCFEAEGVPTHEVVPFDHLCVTASTKSVRVEETTHWVTTEISTVGIHLTSPVIALQVDLGLINETNDLDVVGGAHELNTLKSIVRDEPSAVTGFGAPGNHFPLSVGNNRVGNGWGPKAEIINGIEERCLTVGLLVLGGGVADVVAELGATDEANVRVGLVWDACGIGVVQGSEGSGRVCARNLGRDDGEGRNKGQEASEGTSGG